MTTKTAEGQTFMNERDAITESLLWEIHALTRMGLTLNAIGASQLLDHHLKRPVIKFSAWERFKLMILGVHLFWMMHDDDDADLRAKACLITWRAARTGYWLSILEPEGERA